MELLSNSHFEIKDYFGNLILMYPDNISASISKLKEMLDYAGYSYHCLAINEATFEHRDFISYTNHLFDGCSCFTLVLTEELFKYENRHYSSLFWYYIGYMRSKTQEAIVPLVLDNSKVNLSGTPLQGIDIMYNIDEFMQTLSAKFSSKILCNNYYENRAINLYASKRIFYRCMRLKFRIFESSFQNAKQFYKEYISHRVTDTTFEDYLEEHLICGCRVISFGAEDRLEPPMMLYKDEIHPYIADYPKTLVGKKSFCRMTEQERNESGVRAEITMDVLVPIHKLLGAFLKCYLTCLDCDCPIYMLMALFESDFTGKESEDYGDELPESAEFWYSIYPKETHIDEKLNRFYFGLGFPKGEKPMIPDPELGIGDGIDYIYPQ